MITIKDTVVYYKNNIDKYWDAESYKWIAVKHFQDNWNPEAEDFTGMLKTSLSKADNLLKGGNYYPRRMILKLSQKDPEKMRSLFELLGDETRPLIERIKPFRAGCEELLSAYQKDSPDNEKIKNHYQDLRAICVYLSFMNPDKWFLYKWQMYNDFKNLVEYEETSTESDSEIRKYDNYDHMCREVLDVIKEDDELLQRQQERVAKNLNCYSDPELHLLAQTVIYVSKGMAKKKTDFGAYWPSEEELVDMVEIIPAAKGGFNKIFYGAPGCGKSYYVKKMLVDAGATDEDVFRVTFHPEYTNTDFVGQILPSVEEKVDELTGETKEIVKYQFNPGPFTLALQRAFSTPNMVYLIIEEINRGNAAAIFGDLFQLLDREKDITSSGFTASEYPIRNVPVQEYLIKSKEPYCTVDREKIRKGIFIPGNLTILATMNSSDQNVFTLDTAFKRRWLFEQISNDISRDEGHKYKNWFIPGTDVTWGEFLVALNDRILDYKLHNHTNEDKRLGKYFVTRDCLTETAVDISEAKDEAESFAYKVLEYVWNDVCKIGREEWFDTDKNRTLEDLIDSFINPAEEGSPLDVFQNIEF